MRYYISHLPEYCDAADFLKFGFDPLSAYIGVTPVGVWCFQAASLCFIMAACNWMINRAR